MIQDTLVLIKPDCVRRKMVGPVITGIETLGLSIKHLQQKKLTLSEAETLYQEHKQKWHFPRNIRHVTSGLTVVMWVSGEDAVSKCRNLVESYRAANKDVIKLPQNLVHATTDPNKANEELAAVGIFQKELV